jgi:4-hydroxy-3-methylbut-2-en-1-yl diphosphate reductase
MKVILLSPRGFCAGVEMAVEALNRALDSYAPPIYAYHQIVHNKLLVEQFEARGVRFVDTIAEIPEGALVLYSAHGVSPEVRRQSAERELRVIDATCPLVTKVHRETARFAEAGYTVALIGHAGHDEVQGIIGEAPAHVALVEDAAGVSTIPPSAKMAYVTQTTLGIDDTRQIVDALKERFPQIQGPAHQDICYATQNRQEAIREVSGEVDCAVVVGSANSSNTLRLAEVASQLGLKTIRVDGPGELQADWFQPEARVLLTAGASVPEAVVMETLEWLRQHGATDVEERVVQLETVHFPVPGISH